MNIIDGKAISKQIKDEVKEKVAALKAQGVTVTLAVVQVGNDPASSVYVNNKKKACAYTGMESESLSLSLQIMSKKEPLSSMWGSTEEKRVFAGM